MQFLLCFLWRSFPRAAAAVLGLVLNTAFPGDNDLDFDAAWTVPEAQPAETVYTPQPAVQSTAT